MNLDLILPSSRGRLVGSKYKFLRLLQSISTVNVIPEKKFHPDLITSLPCVFGDASNTWRHLDHFVLIENDSAYLRSGANDKEKLTKALKIIVVSSDHQTFFKTKFNVDSLVLHLRPVLRDLDFDPLPKLKGKNLVYTGNYLPWERRFGKFGYRCYKKIFKSFVNAGWNVHVYALNQTNSLQEECRSGNITLHEFRKQGKELYQELSQYTAGLQSFNYEDVPEQSKFYTRTARPNKLWEYLAAGIPTIGYQGGNGTYLYEGKWGIVLSSLDELDDDNFLDRLPSEEQVYSFRNDEVIDNDIENVGSFFDEAIRKYNNYHHDYTNKFQWAVN